MKRSLVNKCIVDAGAFFFEQGFRLPPYASWTPDKWKHRGLQADELQTCQLGWDVTDFSSGQFDSVGLTLFTLRNGLPSGSGSAKTYAEKIMFVRRNQVTPFHYHARKTEDLINRGGAGIGRLSIQLYNRTEEGGFADTAISVSCDGFRREIEPGGTIILGPGESITVTPELYHSFYAVDGDALIGEVSSVNDDSTDNYFKEPLPRFPQIIEDEPALRLLCTEY